MTRIKRNISILSDYFRTFPEFEKLKVVLIFTRSFFYYYSLAMPVRDVTCVNVCVYKQYKQTISLGKVGSKGGAAAGEREW